MSKKLISCVHVGFPKCASKYLQRVAFKEHSSINPILRKSKKEWRSNKEMMFKLTEGIGTSHFENSKYEEKFMSTLKRHRIKGKKKMY